MNSIHKMISTYYYLKKMWNGFQQTRNIPSGVESMFWALAHSWQPALTPGMLGFE